MEERRARGIHFAEAGSKTADWDHLRAEQNGMKMARGEEGGRGRSRSLGEACDSRQLVTQLPLLPLSSLVM